MNCLVVEDDAALGLALTDCLEQRGYDVSTVTSVAQAFHHLHVRKFGLLILDYNLPDGVSLPIADYASATCPQVRTILLTGSGIFPNGEGSAFAPGVDWILRKPVPMRDVLAVVDYAASIPPDGDDAVGPV